METKLVPSPNLSPVEIQEIIEYFLEKEPSKKNRKEHKAWMENINSWMSKYNTEFGKTYTLRK